MPRYTLMHRDDCVANLLISKPDGCINDIVSIENKELLPVGIWTQNMEKMCFNMRWWLHERTIPANRFNNILESQEFLHSLNMHTYEWLSIQAHCTSLLDGYWIKKNNEQLTWEEVNFYNNPMTPYIGKKLFFEKSKGLSYHSPDCTTGGQMKKKWMEENNEYYLIKIPKNQIADSTFNEILISELLDTLNIPHVQYSLCEEKNISKYNIPSTICKNFVLPGTEFISASQILLQKPRDITPYDYLVDYCNANGCNIKSDLDKMIAIDYLVNNIDRHYGNFGIIRSAETLAITGFAPLYDHERSLTYDTAIHQSAKRLPFDNSINLSNFDIEVLKTFPTIVDEYLTKYEDYGMERTVYEEAKENFTDRVKILE